MKRFGIFILSFIGALLVCSSAQNAGDPNEGSRLTQGATDTAFTFSWWGKAGRTYFIQQSTDLMTWHYLTVIESGQNNILTWGMTTDAEKGFLRLRHSDIPTTNAFIADFDGDKVNNYDELLVGSDPLKNRDGDVNDLPDDWERFFFGFSGGDVPYPEQRVEKLGDGDGDGFTNYQEFLNGTDPTDYYNGQLPRVFALSGDYQFGAPGIELPEPLVVEVQDSNGNILRNAPVLFSIGGQFLSSPRTDSDGRASIFFTTSEELGAQSVVKASAGDLPIQASVEFHVGNVAPPLAPSGVTIVRNADGSIDMTWEDNSNNEADFAIELRNADGEWEYIGTVPANTTSVHINPDRTIAL